MADACVVTIERAGVQSALDRLHLLCADIQLADNSSGIDAVNDILGRFADIPVIFITAHPERFLTRNQHYDKDWRGSEGDWGWGYHMFKSVRGAM